MINLRQSEWTWFFYHINVVTKEWGGAMLKGLSPCRPGEDVGYITTIALQKKGDQLQVGEGRKTADVEVSPSFSLLSLY